MKTIDWTHEKINSEADLQNLVQEYWYKNGGGLARSIRLTPEQLKATGIKLVRPPVPDKAYLYDFKSQGDNYFETDFGWCEVKL